MNLSIKPYKTNTYILHGCLIKSKSVKFWLQQLQLLNAGPLTDAIYPIYEAPNQLWGCFVDITVKEIKKDLSHNVFVCQSINAQLFIPEYSICFPQVNTDEAAKLFGAGKYLIHPDFGLYALTHKIDIGDLLTVKPSTRYRFTKPAEAIFIPNKIKKIEVKAIAPDEILKSIEDKIAPEKKSLSKEPLSLSERLKMKILEKLVQSKRDELNHKSGNEQPSMIQKLFSKIFSKQKTEQLEEDLEKLQERNASELEKLLKMFRESPDEALKYAMPLDTQGTSRGGHDGTFKMSKLWQTLALFNNTSNYAKHGASILADDSFYKLQQQYRNSAQNYIKQKEYEKAAFVYINLLKDYHLAATTLIQGKMYGEAAAVYLKYCNNKVKAAQCYEDGCMYTDAIPLYKELGKTEKVGDLYKQINQPDAAQFHYGLVLREHLNAQKFVAAAVLARNKMNNKEIAQESLLDGWKQNKDAFNCINNYFTNITDETQLVREIESIYTNYTSKAQMPALLQALKHEYAKKPSLLRTKEIAYEIMAQHAKDYPGIIDQLSNFNNDKNILKDINRYDNQ